MSHCCFIALGSNLGSPLEQVNSACGQIERLGTIQARSPWYRSKAVGPGQQPDYINGVLCLETGLEPASLLAELQLIENAHGRKRDIRWGARTLDLDILLYDQVETDTPDLAIPHPRMTERNFVIFPLYDIAPDLVLPDGRTLMDVKAQLTQQGLEKYRETR